MFQHCGRSLGCLSITRVPTAQGKQGKGPDKFAVRENTRNLEILPNTGKFVCTSCKFPDSNGKGYCDICHENFHVFFLKLVCLQSQFYVHKSCELAQGKCAVGQGKNMENTGNLKTLFEWGPCITLHLPVYICSPSFCLCLQIILKVYLDAAATRVTEVPITPHTTVGDVLQCCREPGEETCHLAELWRGIGKLGS